MSELLKPYQRLATSGARGVAIFELDSHLFLAIPQLAKDIPHTAPDMNGGNSDIESLIYRWENKQFVEYQTIPTHGAECIVFFQIGKRSFLAIANLRSGSNPHFNMHTDSMLLEWNGNKFILKQKFATFAAKYCHACTIDGNQLLIFSEGIDLPQQDKQTETASHIYKWNGEEFTLLQTLPTKWGYDISDFKVGEKHFLAVADHAQESILYIWNGSSFEKFQIFCDKGGGRHFAAFMTEGNYYLALANLITDSFLYQWNGTKFVEIQKLVGCGARNFRIFHHAESLYLFRTNFITGTRSEPNTELDSIIYRWNNGIFEILDSYRTQGGTASCPFWADGKLLLATSNSLSPTACFRTDTLIYQLDLSSVCNPDTAL